MTWTSLARFRTPKRHTRCSFGTGGMGDVGVGQLWPVLVPDLTISPQGASNAAGHGKRGRLIWSRTRD
jgi:hypothetical protein